MANFDIRMRLKGQTILRKRGVSMNLRREVQGAYNPATGTTAASTVANYTCIGFISNIDSAAANQFYSTSVLQNTLIEKEDRIVVLSAIMQDSLSNEVTNIEPDSVTDKITIGSVVYSIIAAIPLEPANIPVLYAVQVRR